MVFFSGLHGVEGQLMLEISLILISHYLYLLILETVFGYRADYGSNNDLMLRYT